MGVILPIVFLAMALAPGGYGQQAAPAPGAIPAQESNAFSRQPDTPYTIQSGDDMQIRSFQISELNQALQVRPDGRISLLLLPELQAAGKTVSELTAILNDGYGKQFRDPQISVIITRFANRNVFVGGEVNLPGMVPLSDAATASAAIIRAGGLKDSALPESVVIMRNSTTQKPETIQINVQEILSLGKPDVVLQPTDIIYVPKSTLQVYVTGEVTQPGLVTIQGRLSIASALIRAGGAKSTAKLGNVLLLRDDGSGKPLTQKIDVQRILAKGDPDVPLRPFDVVYIPRTTIAKANLFVDQYMRQLIPIYLNAGFSYLLGGGGSVISQPAN